MSPLCSVSPELESVLKSLLLSGDNFAKPEIYCIRIRFYPDFGYNLRLAGVIRYIGDIFFMYIKNNIVDFELD
jgi:hypothetical protein